MSEAAEGEVQDLKASGGVDAAIKGLKRDCHALVGWRNTTSTWWRFVPWEMVVIERYCGAEGLDPLAPRRAVAKKSARPILVPSLQVAPLRSW